MDFNILIVDDEEELLVSFQRYYSMKGYNITVSNNSQEAFDMIKNGHFQIVITDINMPDMDGIELLKKIKHLRQFIHVIMITGYSSMDRLVSCLEFGAEDFIVKPFNNFNLIDEIIDASAAKHVRWIQSMKDTCKVPQK